MLKLLFYTLIYIISFELIGACLFLLVFTPIYGVKQGIVFSVFTSVSAFTNCGINILPTDIMTVLNSNVLYNIISFLLMFAGGLGFVPLVDIVANKSVKKISFVSKLSLFGMIVHTFIGCTLFCVFEWTNQGTIANLPIYSKLAISINATQSVRCAHLCSVNYQSLSSASKMLMLINILVGASPYSFSGGLYISTISAVIVFMYSYIKYNSSYTLFGLSFDAPVVKRAMFIILYTSTCIIFMTFILSMNENIDLIEILFEVFTVFTLSGTSLANVLNLSKVGKVLIAIITLIARFGTIFFVNKLNRKNGLNAKETFKICNSNDLTV